MIKTTICKTIPTRQGKRQNGQITELKKNKDRTEVYLSTIYPHSFKGYHKHTKQDIEIYCLSGSVLMRIYSPDKSLYINAFYAGEKLLIPKEHTIGIENNTEETVKLLVFPTPFYDPKDPEQENFTREEIE